MRSLLVKWAESVLDTPVLFQLGYGGVSAPVAVPDQEDDVSSWGGDDVEDVPRRGARTRKRSRSTSEIPLVEHPEEEKNDDGDDEDDYKSVDAQEPVEDPVVQRERKAQFVAQKRVLLSPRTSISSAVSNADDLANTHRRMPLDQLPPAPLPLLQMPLLSVGERIRTESMGLDKGPEPVSRDVFSREEAQMQEATHGSGNKDDDWSETQDPEDLYMPATQPESSAKTVKASGRSRSSPLLRHRRVIRKKVNKRSKAGSPILMNGEDDFALATQPGPDENEAPTRRKRSNSPSAGETRTRGSPRRRKRLKKIPFSDEEMDAIREGVARFGTGNWQNIKSHDDRLKNRDAVQIREKCKQMLRCNLL